MRLKMQWCTNVKGLFTVHKQNKILIEKSLYFKNNQQVSLNKHVKAKTVHKDDYNLRFL